MKRFRWIIVAVILVALAGAGYWYVSARKQAAQKVLSAQAFTKVKVSRQDIVQSISADGAVELRDQVNVRPQVSGKVKALYVGLGDQVTKGQLLLTLDDSDYRDAASKAREALASAKAKLATARTNVKITPAQLQSDVASAKAAVAAAELKLNTLKNGTKPEELDQQRAAVNQARINSDSAQADFNRTKELFNAGVVSRQDYDNAQAKSLTAAEALKSAQRKLDQLTAPPDKDDLAEAEAGLVKAKASQRLAEANLAAGAPTDSLAAAQSSVVEAQMAYDQAVKDLNSCNIYAPVSGVVVELSLSLSNKSSATSTTLEVGDPIDAQSGLIAIANPDAAEVHASVDETDIAGVQVGQPVTVTADAFEGREFQGEVTSIAPTGTVTDNVVTFDVTVTVPERSGLRNGMTATADIITARSQQALVVPKEAIVIRRGKPMVQVAATGDARFKRVEVGLEDDTNAEIVSGLSEGDTVLIASAQAQSSNGGPAGFGGGNNANGSNGNSNNGNNSNGGNNRNGNRQPGGMGFGMRLGR